MPRIKNKRMSIELFKKELYLDEFSNTLIKGDHQYLSFYPGIALTVELDMLFNKIKQNYGTKHFPIYRLCDAEYMYCLGRRLPKYKMSLLQKMRFISKNILISLDIINQKTWHGENYSVSQKRKLKNKYLADLRQIAGDGYLAPHLLYSKSRFCEEYNNLMVEYFQRHDIPFSKENYFPFYFVYIILSLSRYRSILYKNKDVLIITSFNQRKKKEEFQKQLAKEQVANVFFYQISPDKSMLEIIDTEKLPSRADLVLIGAGVGSANIINQIRHLNALCIDAGHALDCISKPSLRAERICLLPDEEVVSIGSTKYK